MFRHRLYATDVPELSQSWTNNMNFMASCISGIFYKTHPEGLHNLRPGGSSSLLLRGAIPTAACMMVMNFLYFILSFLILTHSLVLQRSQQRSSTKLTTFQTMRWNNPIYSSKPIQHQMH